MGQVDHTARLPVSLSRIGLLACLVLILCRGTANGAGSGKTEPASGTGGLPTMLVDSEGETAAEEPPKAPTPPPACAQQALGIVIGIALLLLVVVGLQAKGLRRKLAAANRRLLDAAHADLVGGAKRAPSPSTPNSSSATSRLRRWMSRSKPRS